MGGRCFAVLVLLAACPAKSTAPARPAHGHSSAATAGAGALSPAPGSAAPVSQSGSAGVVAATPRAPASNATLAEVGLQASYLDRSVDPCVDFVQFACGGWLSANQIPADQPRWGTPSEAAEKSRTALKGLLEQATGKLGDYYASCMDEAAIEKAGTAAIKPLLDKTTKVKDARSWLVALGELHEIGIRAVFSVASRSEPTSPTVNLTALGMPRLGLGDRDSYLKAERKELRDSYEQHVSRMLALAGVAKPDRAAADVLAIEIELAKLTQAQVEQDAEHGPPVIIDLKAVAKQAKSIDWKAYFAQLGVTPSAKLLVAAPKYLAGLDGVRKRFKPAQWAGYFTYLLVADMAVALPKAFDDEALALEQQLSGTAEKQPRYKRCIESAAWALRDLVDQAYVAKYFSPQARQNATVLVDSLVAAVRDDVKTLDWMSDATRHRTDEALARLLRVVGFPDAWRTYDVTVKRDDFAGNLLRAVGFKVRQWLSDAGKPVTPGDWPDVGVVVAQPAYKPAANLLEVPAGFLAPPFFAEQRSVAANLGGMGVIVARELVRGIDDGLPGDDRAKLEAKGRCVAAQYDTFEAAPKQFVNGKLTLADDVADLAGVALAFRAYRALRKSPAQPIVADGFTEDQQFFLGVGQAWCWKVRPAELQRVLQSGPTAPEKLRVYGALRNLPELAQAFSCAPGTPMHPAQTCTVW